MLLASSDSSGKVTCHVCDEKFPSFLDQDKAIRRHLDLYHNFLLVFSLQQDKTDRITQKPYIRIQWHGRKNHAEH